MSANPRVLVVDDDQVIATTLSLILTRSGFASSHVFSGPEALALMGDSHFDILITDVMMHPMNCVELAKAFCEAYPNGHIFLISEPSKPQPTCWPLLIAINPSRC